MFKESSIHRWTIAVDAREVFMDLVAIAPDGKGAHFVRTQNRKDQLVSGIIEGISLLPDHVIDEIKSGQARLLLTSDLERVSLRENWGAHSALIGTEGFENVVEIRDQTRTNDYGLFAEKYFPTISRDFTFGMAERTLNDGTIEKPISEDEVESIASKLTLSEIKNVAIAFLHSRANSTNEKKLSAKLNAKGFNTFLSCDESGEESERAKKVSTKAFLASTLSEMNDKLLALGFTQDNILIKTNRPAYSRSSPKNSLFVEFLEDRITFKTEIQSREIELSPLSIIELDEGGYVHIGPLKADSEPGPVAFGKGLQMTAFDLFALSSKLSVSGIPRLKLDSSKVLRQLGPLAKNLRMDVAGCGDKCLNLFYEGVALEIGKYLDVVPTFMIASGWLGPYLGPAIARKLGIQKLFIPPHSPWLTPLELAEVELNEKTETTKIGLFTGDFAGSLKEGVIHDI
jgi:N-methylhydantoinase A/oxoprolinase/acetone carboxylase beta subunit